MKEVLGQVFEMLIFAKSDSSFHIEKEDFDFAKGGLGRMWKLFGEKAEGIISEWNEVLSAYTMT